MLNITMYITCFFLSGKPKRILACSLWCLELLAYLSDGLHSGQSQTGGGGRAQ